MLSAKASNELSISRTSAELFAASQAWTSCASRSRSLSAIAVATYCDRLLAGTRRRNSAANSWGNVNVSFLLDISPYYQSTTCMVRTIIGYIVYTNEA